MCPSRNRKKWQQVPQACKNSSSASEERVPGECVSRLLPNFSGTWRHPALHRQPLLRTWYLSKSWMRFMRGMSPLRSGKTKSSWRSQRPANSSRTSSHAADRRTRTRTTRRYAGCALRSARTEFRSAGRSGRSRPSAGGRRNLRVRRCTALSPSICNRCRADESRRESREARAILRWPRQFCAPHRR